MIQSNMENLALYLLSSNRRHVSVDANAFIDKLLDATRYHLFATNAAGTVRTSDA